MVRRERAHRLQVARPVSTRGRGRPLRQLLGAALDPASHARGAGAGDRGPAPPAFHRAEIAEALRMPLSTVSAVLTGIGLGKRSRLEPLEPANRYERKRPGELLHVDIKKLGRICGAGHRVSGSRSTPSPAGHSGSSTCALVPTGRARTASRALHPHPAWRLGARGDLRQLRGAALSPRRLARLLQSSTTTRLPRPPTAAPAAGGAQEEQPGWVLQLAGEASRTGRC
jgi:hypothetical protein